MAISKLNRKELGKAVVDLCEIRELLKKCLKYQGKKLEETLKDIPYDRILHVNLRLALKLQKLQSQVNLREKDGSPLILRYIGEAIAECDKQLEYAYNRQNRRRHSNK